MSRTHGGTMQLAVAAVALTALGCNATTTAKPPATIPPLEETLGKGWQCLAVPTGFEAPGTIFTLDPRGIRQDEIDLSSSFHGRKADAAVGDINQSWGVTVAFSLSIIGKANVSGSISPDLAAKRAVSVSLIKPVQMELIDLPDFETAKQWIGQHPEALDGGRRAFVVRQALVANGLNFQFDGSIVAELGGDAKFSNMVEVSGTPKPQDTPAGKVYVLNQTFPSPLRVCILPEEFILGPATRGSAVVQMAHVTKTLNFAPTAAVVPASPR
jgi:hypothetical protein